ncbi:MAG: TetR/AcrR family transcriptional regulator [Acidobacteriota bacterium]|nr:TetR/AcrR family transcriptional regulator [Acidobacteriota bacterium]
MANGPASTRERIGEAAYDLLAERGVAGLSMRALAERLHVKAASLYKHVRDKDEIVAGLQARGIAELARAIEAAGPWPSAAAQAYRAWALEHPHLYEVTMRRPLLRERLPAGLERDVTSMVIALTGRDHEHARAVWALVHGLVDLELAGRLPADADLDTTWRRAIAMLR